MAFVVGFIAGSVKSSTDARTMPARAKSEYVVGTVIESNSGLMEVRPEVYDYDKDKCCCPVCGGIGWVWQGTFTCDGKISCRARAFVACGTVFVPAHNTWQQKVMKDDMLSDPVEGTAGTLNPCQKEGSTPSESAEGT